MPSWHQVRSYTPTTKDQPIWQQVAPNPRRPWVWMEGAGAGWKRSLLTGYWLRRNQLCNISLLSPALVTSFSTEHLPHSKPDGKFSKSAFYSTSSLNTRDVGLGKEMNFFFFTRFLIYIFSCWMISQLLTLAEKIWVGDKIIWKGFEAGDSLE